MQAYKRHGRRQRMVLSLSIPRVWTMSWPAAQTTMLLIPPSVLQYVQYADRTQTVSITITNNRRCFSISSCISARLERSDFYHGYLKPVLPTPSLILQYWYQRSGTQAFNGRGQSSAMGDEQESGVSWPCCQRDEVPSRRSCKE